MVEIPRPERPQAQVFHAGERRLQERWETDSWWDEVRRNRLLWDHIPTELKARLEAAPFFFLATSSPDGRCDCSFKGGGPNLVRIINDRTFVFPDFDGNGAFMSLGNIVLNPHVGCLFIDFNDGARLRINGRAEVLDSGPLKNLFPDSPRVVRVSVEQVVPNCPKHIPRLTPAL